MCELRWRICPYCSAKSERPLAFECSTYWEEYSNSLTSEDPGVKVPHPYNCRDVEGFPINFTLGACPDFNRDCPSRIVWYHRQAEAHQREQNEFMAQRSRVIREGRSKAEFAHAYFQKKPIIPKLNVDGFWDIIRRDAVTLRGKKQEIKELQDQAMKDSVEAAQAVGPFVGLRRALKARKQTLRFVLPGATEGEVCVPGEAYDEGPSKVIEEADEKIPKLEEEETGSENPVDTETTPGKAETPMKAETVTSVNSSKSSPDKATKPKKPVPGVYPMERQKARRPKYKEIPGKYTKGPIPTSLSESEQKRPAVDPIPIKKDTTSEASSNEEGYRLREDDFTIFAGCPAFKVYAGPMQQALQPQPPGALPLDISGLLEKFEDEIRECGSSIVTQPPWSPMEVEEEDTPESSQLADSQGAPGRLSLTRPPPGFGHLGSRYVEDADPQNAFVIRATPSLKSNSGEHATKPPPIGTGRPRKDVSWGFRGVQNDYKPLPIGTGRPKKETADLQAAGNPIMLTGSSPAADSQVRRTNGLLDAVARKLMEEAVKGGSSGAVESVSPSEFHMPPRAQPVMPLRAQPVM